MNGSKLTIKSAGGISAAGADTSAEADAPRHVPARPLSGPNERLRVLMILHMPWTRDLGAPRVSVEVAEEFERQGLTVDKYDINDAMGRRTYLNTIFAMPLFARHARRYVRRNGHKYDVIQAEQGNLPYTKQELGFEGLLVARSNGLVHFHEQWERENERPPRNPLRRLAKRAYNAETVTRSFATADALILINGDEYAYVADTLGFRDKTYLFHNGLSRERMAAFKAARTPPAQRLQNRQIAFIGHWNRRKGANDLPIILRRVRQAQPTARMLLLGTGHDADTVRAVFDREDREFVSVVPQYRSEELPGLLTDASVGVFPSYMEGFGIGVLELLAAGVPTLAYDVPGPREMLRQFAPPLLVPSGNADQMAQRLLALLAQSPTAYGDLSQQACDVAARFGWQDISAAMIAMYRARLAELKTGSQAGLGAGSELGSEAGPYGAK